MPKRTLTKAELSKLFRDTAHRDWHNASIESRIPREIRDVSFPNDEAIFLAFKDLKPSEVRYVILGQDPYYTRLKSGTPMATGLAFDVPIDCEQKERPYSRPSSLTSDLSMETVVYMVYRLASYVALNLGEDAAVLAFMFC